MIDGLNDIEECVPKPAKKYIPEWWRELPYEDGFRTLELVTAGNIKKCPSFIDYFSKGFIIPMWADSILFYDSTNDSWRWRSSDSSFPWTYHGNEQYLDNVNHKYLGKETFFVFKTMVPWRFITPPGYSILQLPTFFHFHEDFSVIPGIRDADRYHQVNLQVLIHSDKKEIFIKRGTPLAHFMPYKREKETIKLLTYDEASKKDKKKIKKLDLTFGTLFSGSGFYLEERKANNE